MFGVVASDIIGSVYEYYDIKTAEFPLFREESVFTDDTVLTVATASSILNKSAYEKSYKRFARAYPLADYGANFIKWVISNSFQPYNSWGNGSAMRVSPVGFAFNSIKEVLSQAKRSAQVTHNHPEGIKGAL